MAGVSLAVTTLQMSILLAFQLSSVAGGKTLPVLVYAVSKARRVATQSFSLFYGFEGRVITGMIAMVTASRLGS